MWNIAASVLLKLIINGNEKKKTTFQASLLKCGYYLKYVVSYAGQVFRHVSILPIIIFAWLSLLDLVRNP